MKKKDLAGIKKTSKEELKSLAEKKSLDLSKAKAAMKAGQEKNLKKVKLLRHEISQILSILREKEIVEKLDEKKVENNPVAKEAKNDIQKEQKNEGGIKTQKK